MAGDQIAPAKPTQRNTTGAGGAGNNKRAGQKNGKTVTKTSETPSPEPPAPEKWCPVCGGSYEDETPYMLQCEACRIWTHIKCIGIDRPKYRKLERPEADALEFFCPECTHKDMKKRRKKNQDLLAFVEADKEKTSAYHFLRVNNKGVIPPPKGRSRATDRGSNTGNRSSTQESRASNSDDDAEVQRLMDLGIVKPPDAYMLFRHSFAAANPQLTGQLLQWQAVMEWRDLTKGDKRKFAFEAERLMTKYRQDCMGAAGTPRPVRKKRRLSPTGEKDEGDRIPTPVSEASRR